MTELSVHRWGCDDPGSDLAFKDLQEAHAYLKGRLEYWDGQDSGHSDYMRYFFTGFTMKDIGAYFDDYWVKFDPNWKPKETTDE